MRININKQINNNIILEKNEILLKFFSPKFMLTFYYKFLNNKNNLKFNFFTTNESYFDINEIIWSLSFFCL
jgi:hypothetical protein